jgi:hypothetical protein
MADLTPDSFGWYSINGDPTHKDIQSLRAVGQLDKLSITKARLITVDLAKRLRKLHSVHQLWLWCDVTRFAMRHIVRIPGLAVLDVLNLKPPGTLADFDLATNLHTVRANNFLKENDVLEITKCPSLQELGLQNAEITPTVLDALLSLQQLKALDIEGSLFDDQMAQRLSTSTIIESLEIGATKITRDGLQHLVSMKQLRSLDLWATDLVEDDFGLLLQLPALEYISIGGYAHLPSLDSKKLVPLLLSFPSLKRIWLDDVSLTTTEREAFEAKLEQVRIT